jgi:hypothetical protein
METKWKAAMAREYGKGRNAILIQPQDFGGKPIRVTVEVEDRVCCDTWRGRSLWVPIDRMRFDETTTMATYCPECGRRL